MSHVRSSNPLPPIDLNLAKVVAAARKAYTEGRLQAQVEPFGRCRYSGPCAVGAAMTPDEIASLSWVNSGCGVTSLIRRGFATADDKPALVALQNAHDDWVRSGHGEGDFVRVLTELEEQVRAG